MAKTVKITEAQAEYGLAIDKEQLAQEPIVLERDGNPGAVIVPFHEYTEFSAWRRQHEKAKTFEEERAAFYEMKETLLRDIISLMSSYDLTF